MTGLDALRARGAEPLSSFQRGRSAATAADQGILRARVIAIGRRPLASSMQPRDRLKGHSQEGQHSAAEGGTRDRVPPASGTIPSRARDRHRRQRRAAARGAQHVEPGPPLWRTRQFRSRHADRCPSRPRCLALGHFLLRRAMTTPMSPLLHHQFCGVINR